MTRVVTMACKDLKIIGRDWFGVFWIFVFPLLYAVFFGSIFGGRGGGARNAMPVAIVDEARNDDSESFIARLAKSDAIRVDREAGTKAVVLDDLDRARNRVRKGDCVAYVRIKPGYGGDSFQMFSGRGESAALEVGVDPSRAAEAGYLQGVLMETTFQGFTDRFRDKDAMKKQIRRSIDGLEDATAISGAQKTVLETFLDALESFVEGADFDQLGGAPDNLAGQMIKTVAVVKDESGRPRSSFDVMFPSAILWGLIGCMAGFAISIVRERTAGTLLRLKVAPVSRAQVLGGKALACFLTCGAVAVFLLLIGRVALGVHLGSLPLLALAIASTGLCFTGMMMVVSVMGKTEQAVAGAGWGVMMPLAMIGGAMVPLIAMPPWMLTLSNLSPVKWGIYAIEGAVWRDFSLLEMLLPCGILVGIGVGLFALGVWVFRRVEG